MLSLVRTGATILTISAYGDSDDLAAAIENFSYARKTTPIESFNFAGEGDTLIFFSTECAEEIRTFQTTAAPTAILCGLINHRLTDKIQRIRVSPPNIVMRLMGDMDKAIDRIALDFKAQEALRGGLMQNLDEPSVLVNFTSSPLNQLVKIEDFHKRALLIDKPFGQLLTFLRARAQEYLNTALGSPDWNEVQITIFDAMDQFNLHYQRLLTVIQGLDMGIVISESWEPEYTVGLRKSDVYQVKTLTPLPPREIKMAAMGLEYDDAGRRVADFDVYYGGKKISWASERKVHPMPRNEIGLMYRKRLLDKLPAVAKSVLLRMDTQIEKIGLNNK